MIAQDQIIEQVQFLESRGLLDDAYGVSLKHAVLAGHAVPSDYEELRRRLSRAINAAQLGTAIPFRSPRLPNSGVCLGFDQAGAPIYQDLTSKATHMAIAGSTGAGKTSVWFWLLAQLFGQPIGFTGIELYKRELRHLVPLAWRFGRPMAVVSHRQLRWNPLEPDGVDPRLHLQAACGSLSRCLGLPDRASMLLRQTAQSCFSKAGVFAGELDRCPTLFDVIERAKAAEANAAAKEALLDRLGSLLHTLGPGVLAYHRAWRPSHLLDKLVVLELAGAPESVRQWLVTDLLFKLFHGQVARGVVNAPLGHITLLDDAQRFLTGDGLGGMTPIAELLGLVRSTGLAIAANFQSLEPVPTSILSNMNARIVGTLGSAGDLRRVASEFGLDAEQAAWARQHLAAGTYLAHFNVGAYRNPFVLKLPKPTLPALSDADLERGRAELDAIPVVEATEFRHWPNAPVARTPSQPDVSPGGAQAGTKPKPEPAFLTPHQLRLLHAIVAQPLQPQSAYAKLSGMKPADCKAARIVLLSAGLIVERRATLNAGGRQPVLLEATPSGEAVARASSDRS